PSLNSARHSQRGTRRSDAPNSIWTETDSPLFNSSILMDASPMTRRAEAVHRLYYLYLNKAIDAHTYDRLRTEGVAAMEENVERNGAPSYAEARQNILLADRLMILCQFDALDRPSFHLLLGQGADAMGAALERLRSGERPIIAAAPVVVAEVAATAADTDEFNSEPVTPSSTDLIAQLRRENENGASLRFSRSCGVCLNDWPVRRAVLVECGHFVCLACAEQLEADASSPIIDCPFCRCSTRFVAVFENQVNNRETKETQTI
ncbi:hypothetical protein PMAYCL1PPCAC_25089, partial [Pristionchus mayeri]